MCEDNNKARIEEELRSTRRPGIEDLIREMHRIGYYQAKCVGHDRFQGGTANHSLWVLFVARIIASRNPVIYGGINDESLILVCLLHDVCDAVNGYPAFKGHGRRSALILNQIGVQLSDEEMAAIRFHRGHWIYDEFDRVLEPYAQTVLIGLLKRADHIAAGVMNHVPYNGQLVEAMTYVWPENSLETIIYNPLEKNWMVDMSAYGGEFLQTKKGKVARNTLHEGKADLLFGVNLFHMASYDLIVLKRRGEAYGVFTVVNPSMGMGDLYRCDHGGFRYKSVVLYFNKTHQLESKHYLMTEDVRGQWSVVMLENPKPVRGRRYEFIKRTLLFSRLPSEDEAVQCLRTMHHGINVFDADWFQKLQIVNNTIAENATGNRLPATKPCRCDAVS